MDEGKTYIKVLIESSKKKQEVLEQILSYTQEQSEYLQTEPFDDEQFENAIDAKGELLLRLEQLDDGFELTYEKLRDELQENKEKYKDEILSLKNYVRLLTDLSVSIQTLEQRNKEKLEKILTVQKAKIRQVRVGNQTAANYYKSSPNPHNGQSYFLDKKN